MKNKFLLVVFGCLISSNADAVNSTPTVSRVRGDQYTPAVAPTQQPGSVGVLDSTFGTAGSLDINLQLASASAQAMQVLSDGSFFIAATDTFGFSNLAKYNAQGTLQSSFNGTGIVSFTPATHALVVRTIMIDVQGRILVAGGSGPTSGWLKRVTADGALITTFTSVGVTWQYIAGLAEQTSGEIIAVGSNGSKAQIARYQLNGTVDTSFGTPATPGKIVLDGSSSGLLTLPDVTAGLSGVVVDANNLIYVAYKTTAGDAQVARFTAVGLLDATFGTNGVATLSYLATATAPLYMAMDLHSNLVIGGQAGTSIRVTSIASAAGGVASPAFTNATITSAGNTLTIQNLVTTSDGTIGKIYILGSHSTAVIKSRVTRLTNQGVLDATFNAYNAATNPSGVVGGGYNEFRISIPDTEATLLAGAVSPVGQLYVAGRQKNGVTTTGYVSRLYNDLNTYQVHQSPETQEQGILDTSFGAQSESFGAPLTETYAGVVTPFNGIYRGALQQKAKYVIELATGNMLLGMDGYSDTAAQSSMTLVQLTNQGVLYGGFGTGGKVTLPNLTSTNERLTSMMQDGSGNIYVTGYSDTGAIFRKYTSAGVLIWNGDSVGAGYRAYGAALEGDNRVLLFSQTDATRGLISGYLIGGNTANPAGVGVIDTSFHSQGTPAGYILSTDYTGSPATVLNMGPVRGGIVDPTGNFYTVFKNNETDTIDVAGIYNAGPNLISTFGVSGIVHDVFPTLSVATTNAYLAFNEEGNIIVVASGANIIQVALLNAVDGSLNSNFNGGNILSITVPGAAITVNLTKVTGISDGSLVITGYDDGADDTMLIVRVTVAGALDTTFNSQGTTPGICTIQVGDQISNFAARIATSLMVQSKVGINQGNLVVSAYEQQFSTHSTPMVMRVFGEPGTTEVKASPLVVTVPGDFDPSYNGTGSAETYADGASSPTVRQQVKAIRQVVGTNIMTIISDGTNSWSTRLLSDSTIDTTYGVGVTGSVPIIKGGNTGAYEGTNGMVVDGEGNMIVFGANADLDGYVKRLNISNGLPLTNFGGYTGDPSTILYPVGTAYGLMSSVEAVGQLTNGNIVIAGNIDGVGTAMMLSPTGTPSTTFAGNGLLSSGSNITSVSVDAQDNLYFAIGYVDINNIQRVCIMKTNSQGVLDTTFGVNGFVDAAISNIDNLVSIRLVRDISGNIIVAASFGDSIGKIAVRRFLPDGSIDQTFHGGTQLEISFPVDTHVVVTSLVALQDGRTLVSGYQYDAIESDNDDYEYVACVNIAGNMDGSFGSQATAGLVTFQIATAEQYKRYLWDMNIQTNGGILLAGAELPTSNTSTPLTMRLLGYENIQAVSQFPGYQPVADIPNILNYFFSGTGIASTHELISNIVDGGSVVVDSTGQPIIGGYTTDKKFVLAKFTRDGVLDPAFASGTGIAQTVAIPNLLQGFYLAVDSEDKIYIGGIANDYRFVLARFSSSGIIDATFGGTGIVQSSVFTNLSAGGYVTIDSTGRPVVGGMSTDGKLVAARFTTLGAQDTFGSSGLASVTVSGLIGGGYVVTNALNQVFVAGITSNNELVSVKFLATGLIDTAYGISGIALSGVIDGLTVGGAIALDSQENVIIGGYTTDQILVAARFLASGILDTNFNATGIAYSDPMNVLTSIGSICVDYLDRIVVAGPARLYDGLISIVATRFTAAGVLDIVFSPSGMGTTGPIVDLVFGGYVSTDKIGNVFLGGFTDNSSLIVAELYSGNEIIIADPSALTPAQYKIFHYGNNPDLFKDFLVIDFYARQISDPAARAATISAVVSILDDLVVLTYLQPGWNLIWHMYIKDSEFQAAEISLIDAWPASVSEIAAFFTYFNGRREALAYTPS